MKTNSRMIVCLMTMVSTSFAHGQTNVLPNGDFSLALELTDWTAEGTGDISYSNFQDADNAPPSGAMGLHYLDTNDPERAVSACFPVQPNVAFDFGGKYIPEDIFGVVADAEMTCSSFTDANCTSAATNLGLANGVGPLSANANFISWIPVHGTLGPMAQSAQCVVSTRETFNAFPNMNQGAGATVDDLFFSLSSTQVTLGGYLSGSWYDPTTSGQGFEMEFTAQGNTLLATWFTYSPDNSGTTQWVYGQGTYDPMQTTVTISAVLTSGTGFIPRFVKSDVKKTPWGNLTFSFIDCNHATLTWNSTLPGYGSGTEQLQRLTSIAGTSCPQ